jgi:uncharacterized DUF497 family protein
MDIEFDDAKDRANIAKHGISLRAAPVLLVGSYATVLDDRKDYGEERWQAIGEIAGRLFVCVYTMRRDACRVISLRKANRRESDAYRKNQQGGR